jgi:hypothetical protein
LLKKPVSKVNLETGVFEPLKKGETNEDALKRYKSIKHLFVYYNWRFIR